MFDVNQAISWARRRLGLHSSQQYDPGDGRIAAADAVQEIQLRAPHEQGTYTITTVADQGEYTVPGYVRVIQDIAWPSDWDGEAIELMLEPQLRELQLEISAGDIELSTSQPVYYAWFRKSTGASVLMLENAESVEGDLTITLYYHHFEYKEDMTDAPIEATQQLMFKNCIAWKLAQIYKPEAADYWERQFKESIDTWKMATGLAINKVSAREVHEF